MDGNTTSRESFWPSRVNMGQEATPFGMSLFEARPNAEGLEGFQKGVKSYDGSGHPHNHLAKVR